MHRYRSFRRARTLRFIWIFRRVLSYQHFSISASFSPEFSRARSFTQWKNISDYDNSDGTKKKEKDIIFTLTKMRIFYAGFDIFTIKGMTSKQ